MMVHNFDLRTETKMKFNISLQNSCNVIICYARKHNVRNILHRDIGKLKTESYCISGKNSSRKFYFQKSFFFCSCKLIYHPLTNKQMHLDYLNERHHLFQEYTFSFNVHLHLHGSFSELISEVDSQEWTYGIHFNTSDSTASGCPS